MSKLEAIDTQENKQINLVPSEVIFEILIRTDIESIPILRCVCKEWCNLLSQPQFMHHHHQRSRTVRGYILRPKPDQAPANAISFTPHMGLPLSEALPPLDFLPEPVKIEASTTHGILCCVGLKHRRKYYVCKPTTKQWTTIPPPKTRYKSLKMDMVVAFGDDNILSFKIVRLSNYKGNLRIFHWEVFDSKTWNWTKLDHIQSFIGRSMALDTHSVRKGFVVKGCCFCCPVNSDDRDAQIMVFDIWAEKLETLQLPQEALNDIGIRLVNIDGNLGLISSPSDGKYNMWVMPSLVDQRWEKKLSFNMQENRRWWGMLLSLVRFVVDDVVLFMLPSSTMNRMWCNLNLKDKTYKDVHVDDRVYIPETTLFFQSDFFPCKIGSRQRRGDLSIMN